MKITFKHLSVCVQGWLSQETEPCSGDLSSGNLLGNALGMNVCEEVRETGPSRRKKLQAIPRGALLGSTHDLGLGNSQRRIQPERSASTRQWEDGAPLSWGRSRRHSTHDETGYLWFVRTVEQGSSTGSDGQESPCRAGDLGSIPGSEDLLEKEMATQLQYTCLGNPMDRGAWRATAHGGHKELDTTEWQTLDTVEPYTATEKTKVSLIVQWNRDM